jgi:hypothetical protein
VPGMRHHPDEPAGDVAELLALLERTGAVVYLHQGCGCEWGSRGERDASPSCTVDLLLSQFSSEAVEKRRVELVATVARETVRAFREFLDSFEAKLVSAHIGG